jgi:hypothetical protein
MKLHGPALVAMIPVGVGECDSGTSAHKALVSCTATRNQLRSMAGSFQSQKLPGILKADISYHASNKFEIVGEFATLDFTPKQIAQHAAKILMPGKRHE